MATLQENVRAVRAVLETVDCISLPSHPASAIQHIYVKPVSSASLLPPSPDTPKPKPLSHGLKSNPASVIPHDVVKFNLDEEERLLQQVVEDCLNQGVMITRAKHLRGQELVEPRPSICLAVTAELSKKACEKAAGVIKSSLVKTLAKRQ